MTTCEIDGCEKPKRCRGWCEMHYVRWRTHGDPTKTVRPTLGMSVEERFWLHVDKSDDCWEWTGLGDGHGYGLHPVGRQNIKAHRYSYELNIGPIAEDLVIDHLCMNKICVRPDHLEPVTIAENNRRYTATIAACAQGHEYTEANTLRTREGWRACRECNRLNSARWRAERARVAS